MIKTILTAAVLVFGLTSAAHAAPVKPAASPNISASSDLVEIGKKYYNRKGKFRGPNYRGRNYYRGGYGRNYYRAPKGWRSYSYRPFGWQRRGCIIVGPVWYCP
jgi:hypothetical protein